MTEIPDRPMDVGLARYQVKALLDRLTQWSSYAAEPVTELAVAQDRLQALARVMQAVRRDVIDRWDEELWSGIPARKLDYDGEPMTDPRIAESYARHDRERRSA